MLQKITLKELDQPSPKDLNKDIKWVCESFDLCSGRDFHYNTFKVFKKILTSEKHPSLSSQILAEELEMNIGLINYHLRSLIESGFIQRQKRLILLRGGTLKAAVQAIRKDTEKIFDKIEAIAEDIDSVLGHQNR